MIISRRTYSHVAVAGFWNNIACRVGMMTNYNNIIIIMLLIDTDT